MRILKHSMSLLWLSLFDLCVHAWVSFYFDMKGDLSLLYFINRSLNLLMKIVHFNLMKPHWYCNSAHWKCKQSFFGIVYLSFLEKKNPRHHFDNVVPCRKLEFRLKSKQFHFLINVKYKMWLIVTFGTDSRLNIERMWKKSQN